MSDRKIVVLLCFSNHDTCVGIFMPSDVEKGVHRVAGQMTANTDWYSLPASILPQDILAKSSEHLREIERG